MSSRIDTELAMNALLMAVWRRKPADPVMVHPDQGSPSSQARTGQLEPSCQDRPGYIRV